MLFNSINFIYFLIIFIVTISISPNKSWKYIIIIFSSFFYGYWDPKFLILLYFVVFSTYISSTFVYKHKSKNFNFANINNNINTFAF